MAAWIASVSDSGAGPPLEPLIFTPKSPSGPPGLWLAERMMPAAAAWRRIRFDAAGVERMPPVVVITRATPWAAAIRRITPIASRLPKRPSPPTTSVPPAIPGTTRRLASRKLSK